MLTANAPGGKVATEKVGGIGTVSLYFPFSPRLKPWGEKGGKESGQTSSGNEIQNPDEELITNVDEQSCTQDKGQKGHITKPGVMDQ